MFLVDITDGINFLFRRYESANQQDPSYDPNAF